MLILANLACSCSGDCPALHSCDIREESCQDHVMKVASCLRDSDTTDVVIEVVDADEFARMQAEEADAVGETADGRDLRRGLALLTLMPEDVTRGELVRAHYARVGAFFSSETGVITILHRGGPLDDATDAILLLHETVHAIQSEERERRGDEAPLTFDAALTLRGMTEGDATLYDDLATLWGYGFSPDSFDWDSSFDHFRNGVWQWAHGSAAPYQEAFSDFPYAFGGAYVNRAWRDGGNDAVKELIRSPPASTREVLAGYGASPPEEGWVKVPDVVPAFPADLDFVGQVSLGAWLFEAVNARLFAGIHTFDERVDRGFSGDVLWVFRRGNDVAVVWRLRFDSSGQATAFRQAASQWADFETFDEGRDVVLIKGSTSAVAESVASGITWISSPDAIEPSAMSDVTAARLLDMAWSPLRPGSIRR